MDFRSPLRSRYANKASRRTSGADPTRMTNSRQEESLCACDILDSEQCGHPENLTKQKEVVTPLNRSAGGKDCPHNCLSRFLARCPDLRSIIGKETDTQRMANNNPELLQPIIDASNSCSCPESVKSRCDWHCPSCLFESTSYWIILYNTDVYSVFLSTGSPVLPVRGIRSVPDLAGTNPVYQGYGGDQAIDNCSRTYEWPEIPTTASHWIECLALTHSGLIVRFRVSRQTSP